MLKIPQKTEYVINTLLSAGFEAYIVGGCVRDMLLGKTPNDFDITTSAEPDEIIALFPKTVPTGIKHGTVTVIVDSEPIEVTTFRTEGEYTDCRRPDKVTFVKSLEEDLARRDFTVNAMAYNKKSGLMDYFSGQKDLENKVLRAVGQAELRFQEDALRILRLFRFASVLDFNIEPNTLKAALNKAENLKNISVERIAVELKKAVIGKNLKQMSPLINSGSLEFIGFKNSPDFFILQQLPLKQSLRLFAFLYFSGCDVAKTLDLLKESNENKNYCKTLTLLMQYKIPDNKTDLKQLLSFASKEMIEDWLTIKNTMGYNTAKILNLLEEIIKNNEPYLISHLKISGDYLKKIGISGKEIGTVLENLRQLVIRCPEKNNKIDLKTEINKIKP